MSTPLDQLKELAKLRDENAISDVDFEEKKDQLLRLLFPETRTPLAGTTQIIERQTIGNYRILDQLGSGAMGIVYRARHISEEFAHHTGDVAVKIMHPNYAQQQEFRSRFIQEAAAGHTINNKHTAHVKEFIVEDSQLALVMELVDGQLLSKKMPRNGMHPAKVLAMLTPLAEAIDQFHKQGIIHRDLKPENIKVRADGTLVILDFGIAKNIHNMHKQTQTSRISGTVAYMAPEQMNGTAQTAAIDQFAFALLTYEMLCGNLPWKPEATDFEIINLKLQDELIPLEHQSSDISTPLSLVVMKALSLQPSKRFASCLAFMTAVAEAITKPTPSQPKKVPPHSKPATPAPQKPLSTKEKSPSTNQGTASQTNRPQPIQERQKSSRLRSCFVMFGILLFTGFVVSVLGFFLWNSIHSSVTTTPAKSTNPHPNKSPLKAEYSDTSFMYVVYNTAKEKEPWLNLRSKPSVKHSIVIAKMKDGTKLKISSQNGRWKFVTILSGRNAGKTGWAHSKWIRRAK